MYPYKRIQQRPVPHVRGVYWETDPHFDLDNHFWHIGLPGAQGKEALEECVSEPVSTPMDPTKPMWDWHLVEDYEGGSALICSGALDGCCQRTERRCGQPALRALRRISASRARGKQPK